MVGLSSYSLAMFVLGSILSAAAVVLSKKLEWDREKGTPFECGFDPRSNSRLAFSLRFFLIAVVFLVFDVEIALLLPLAVSEGASDLGVWGALGSGFLIILLVGTYHEWRQGALDWKL